MAKKKTNVLQREERVPQREAYRYSGNPDDEPEVHKDKPMAQVASTPSLIPLRREDVREADVLPQKVAQEKPSSVVDTGVYDAGPQRAVNHSVDGQPSLAKGDVPTAGGATAQVSSPVSVPNIFTSGGVRGAFEPTPSSEPAVNSGESADGGVNVNWEEMGRQPVGWSPEGEPVYEWNGYDADKRPPLGKAVEQAYDPVLQGPISRKANNGKAPEFQKDPEKKDGGFLNWLGGLFKKRNGQREGETDDEYDERMTRNKMRIATLANALRHMANLYYTSKGGIPQQFNDPNAELEKALKERKAERVQKNTLAASQAYKDAQLQLQRDKNNADAEYKKMSLYYKGRDADRADQRFEWDKDKDKWNRNRLSLNDAWKQKFEEDKQKNTEKYQRGRLAIEGKKATAAMLRATNGSGGGGSGSGGNMVNLASPKGHLNRKKELSVYEENQIFNFLKKNGNITGEYIAGWSSMTPEEKRAKMQFAISYAASDPSQKGKQAREYLKKHHGYSEVAASAVGGLDFN